ncbi:protein of unknown function [Paraburkholderia kururiensis]
MHAGAAAIAGRPAGSFGAATKRRAASRVTKQASRPERIRIRFVHPPFRPDAEDARPDSSRSAV